MHSDRRTANVIKEKGFDSKGVKNCSIPRTPSSAGPSCMLTFLPYVNCKYMSLMSTEFFVEIIFETTDLLIFLKSFLDL